MLAVTRPELEIILCCAKVEVEKKELDRIKNLLKRDIDWKYLITTARLHKVSSLLCFNLNKIGEIYPDLVPKEVREYLQKLVFSTTRKNLFFVKELSDLLDLFESNNISVISYKGLVLAAAVYKNLSLRQFVDLDFLVSRKQYFQTQELLIDRGYIVPEQNEVKWERSFINPKKKIGVDLHQGLTPDYMPLRIDFPVLWERLETVAVGGVKVKSFSPEDLLIVLCVQLAKDSQWTAEVLIKVCDIAELLRVYPELDWKFIWQECSRLGTKRILLFSLYVVDNLLNAEIPDSMRSKVLADRISQAAGKQVCEEFFLRSEESFKNKTYVERTVLRQLSRELWQDKVKHFFESTFIPSEQDYAFFPMLEKYTFIYYLLRPLRLGIKYLETFAK